MKVGLRVAYGETFKMMWYLVTLTQGEDLYLKIGKYPFNNFWQYIRHYLQHSYDMGLKGSLRRDLKNDMTFSDVTVFTENLENIHFLIIFDNISDIIHSKVMILGEKVACVETLK